MRKGWPGFTNKRRRRNVRDLAHKCTSVGQYSGHRLLNVLAKKKGKEILWIQARLVLQVTVVLLGSTVKSSKTPSFPVLYDGRDFGKNHWIRPVEWILYGKSSWSRRIQFSVTGDPPWIRLIIILLYVIVPDVTFVLFDSIFTEKILQDQT